VLESRTTPTPAVLGYLDSMIALFRRGGLSADLTHHVMHAMGSRIMGFSQELFTAAPAADPQAQAAMAGELAGRFPHVAEMAMTAAHAGESVVGSGCDDRFEFEFALDLLLNGIAELHRRGWMSAQ
jgi:hypothetical protein